VSIFINQPHGWIFLVLMVVAAASVVWFYRRVPPTIGRSLKILLAVLRAAALALLLLALIEPVLALTRVVSERPVVAILFDTSRSMSITDGTAGARRADEAFTLLNEVVLPRIARESGVEAYAFSLGVEPLTIDGRRLERAPYADGASTDIGGAFAELSKEFKGRNLGAVVLASDGASNRGMSPYDVAMELEVPVFVLGVGSVEPQADIAVREVITNRISYAGEILPIEVRISSAGYGGSETVIELVEDGVLLDSVPVRLSATGEEVELTFKTVPSTPGVHRYTISIPEAPGELTTTNNARVVATTAFKGKIRVLLMASRPSWDFAFLRREFEADQNVDVTAVAITERAPARNDPDSPESREELFGYDLVVLVESDWEAPLVPADWLSAFVRNRGGGLLLVGLPGSRADEELLTIAPVVPGGRPSLVRETRPRLTSNGEGEPTTRVVEDRFENVEVWASLPPVWTATDPWWVEMPDARTLVTGGGAGDAAIPIVVARRAGAGNVVAVLAEGLWRWKLAGPRATDVDVYDRFLSNAARWLTARGELERVVVTSDKDVYAAGETIVFSGQVYREDFRLAGDAAVTVSVAKGEGAAPVESVVLEPGGEFYRGSVGPLEPGRYIFEAGAVRAGEELGDDRGEFTVEPFSLEDSDVRRRPALLAKLAEDSGGGYFLPGTVDDIPADLDLTWARRVSQREFEIWNSPWLLLGFVGLLSVEWTLRRRKGLP